MCAEIYKRFVNIVQILCRYCADIVQILSNYCADIVQILCKYCADIVHILCRYCAHIVQNHCMPFWSICEYLAPIWIRWIVNNLDFSQVGTILHQYTLFSILHYLAPFVTILHNVASFVTIGTNIYSANILKIAWIFCVILLCMLCTYCEYIYCA